MAILVRKRLVAVTAGVITGWIVAKGRHGGKLGQAGYSSFHGPRVFSLRSIESIAAGHAPYAEAVGVGH